jgi:hypothetical protein
MYYYYEMQRLFWAKGEADRKTVASRGTAIALDDPREKGNGDQFR